MSARKNGSIGRDKAQKKSLFVRFISHFLQISRHLRGVYVALLTLILVGAVAIAAAEKISIGEAVYFSFITGLTVGYGDIAPHTTVGRIVGVLLGFVGILFTGLVIAVEVKAVREAWSETQKPE